MQVTIQLADSVHVGGSTLRGTVAIPADWCRAGVSLTLTLTWTTEGKGRRDSSYFDYVVWHPGPTPPATVPFAVILPAEPWSYEGQLIKIGWTLQATARYGDMTIGAELPLLIQSPFLHGQVPYR